MRDLGGLLVMLLLIGAFALLLMCYASTSPAAEIVGTRPETARYRIDAHPAVACTVLIIDRDIGNGWEEWARGPWDPSLETVVAVDGTLGFPLHTRIRALSELGGDCPTEPSPSSLGVAVVGTCVGDLDFDRVVRGTDLGRFRWCSRRPLTDDVRCWAADLDGDKRVTRGLDLGLFKGVYNTICYPR